jgi:hypothetical protein
MQGGGQAGATAVAVAADFVPPHQVLNASPPQSNAGTQGNGELADLSRHAGLGNQSLPAATLVPLPAPELSGKAAESQAPGNLAFAVRVQPTAQTAPAAPPMTDVESAVEGAAQSGLKQGVQLAASDSPAYPMPSTRPVASEAETRIKTTNRQPASDSPATKGSDGSDNASAPARPVRQTTESGGDQTGSNEADRKAKAAEKFRLIEDESKQAPAPPVGSSASATGFAGEISSEAAGAVRRGASLPDGASPDGASPDRAAQAAEAHTAPLTAPPAGPMKEISLQVEAAEGQKVEVRMVQRAGDLQIAVRSVDSDTAQGLRHGLSDLASRLNESGYHAETWRPGQPSPSQQSPSDGSQSQSGGSQQDRGQRDNNSRNRPRWIQELEANLGSGSNSKGQFNGIGS